MDLQEGHLVRTLGAPREDDPRNGELHHFFGRLPDHFDLEPGDEDTQGVSAHYVKAEGPPDYDEDGKEVWRYLYRPAQVDSGQD